MVERGVGDYQLRKARRSKARILEALSDGKWHRYKEIEEKTELSAATVSKHLKEMEGVIIQKRVDLESGEYPYPAYYKIGREEFDFPSVEYIDPRTLKLIGDKGTRLYLHILLSSMGYSTLEFLHFYFKHKNEEVFNAIIEHYVIMEYHVSLQKMKEKLTEIEKKGGNVEKILTEAKELYAQDYKGFLTTLQPSLATRILAKLINFFARG